MHLSYHTYINFYIDKYRYNVLIRNVLIHSSDEEENCQQNACMHPESSSSRHRLGWIKTRNRCLPSLSSCSSISQLDMIKLPFCGISEIRLRKASFRWIRTLAFSRRKLPCNSVLDSGGGALIYLANNYFN